jgi:SAM-dependent methyltransferase
MNTRSCRFCGQGLTTSFCDLGTSPLSNAFLSAEQLNGPETHYPLHAYVCDACLLVQLEQVESPQAIFSEYAYLSSYSDTWLAHARGYAKSMIERLGLDASHRVVEIASNDGYLLQYFKAAGVPVLGIEPAANAARIAEAKGIQTIVQFFGAAAARDLVGRDIRADLLVGNNVLAHVPDLNDFVAGLKILLAPGGTITLEFPHLLQLIRGNQFDTIYHEHFSYFSFLVVDKVLARHGLAPVDVERIPTHGGSLRVHARHAGGSTASAAARALLAEERSAGLDGIDAYRGFQAGVTRCKRRLLAFLIDAKAGGRSVAAYGAPAKGNTLLNYCGIRTDFIDYAVDRSPRKQGLFLPGTRIPVYAPGKIDETKPDLLLILPWNIREEVMQQMARIRAWGGRFVVPIPDVAVIE